MEFRFSNAPTTSKSMRGAVHDLSMSRLWIVYPGKESYPLATNITALPMGEIHTIGERARPMVAGVSA